MGACSMELRVPRSRTQRRGLAATALVGLATLVLLLLVESPSHVCREAAAEHYPERCSFGAPPSPPPPAPRFPHPLRR